MALLPPATPFDPYAGSTIPPVETAFDVTELPDDARLGREEQVVRYVVNGAVMALYQRNKVSTTDWLHATAIGTAHATASRQPYRGTSPDRSYRAALLLADGVI